LRGLMKMARMLKWRFVLPAGFLLICSIQYSFAAEENSQRLVSPELLKHADLKLLWDNELPIRKGEKLKQLLVLGSRIYSISSRNYMFSLNRENGDMVFGKIVTPGGLPVSGLGLYGSELITTAGSKIILLDPDSGKEKKDIDVGFAIMCPTAYNRDFFYLGGVDNRMHALRAENMVQIFEVSAKNESMITSIVADEYSAIFATVEGNVISVKPDEPRQFWQFDAAGGIAGPIVRDGMSLFFASKDTNVYRLDMFGMPERARLIWKYQTDGILDKEPRVTYKCVYQYVQGKGVTAIDKERGTFLWTVPGGLELLAEADDKAYVITKNETLAVMDNLRAKRLYSLNFAGVSKYTTNVEDSKIYIADERGRIACLQPIK
jgi:outer membrane protein assembly factor BamB